MCISKLRSSTPSSWQSGQGTARAGGSTMGTSWEMRATTAQAVPSAMGCRPTRSGPGRQGQVYWQPQAGQVPNQAWNSAGEAWEPHLAFARFFHLQNMLCSWYCVWERRRFVGLGPVVPVAPERVMAMCALGGKNYQQGRKRVMELLWD